MLNDLLCWWVLPSLITFLIVTRSYSREEKKPIEKYNSIDWIAVIFMTVAYPLGLIGVFCIDVWPTLIKER
jgi:hypothetical protein